ncbi:hypothetical protein LCGC14_2881770, partial [marine sediment metagenome]
MDTSSGTIALDSIRRSYLPTILAWRSDRDVMRYLPTAPVEPTWEEILDWYVSGKRRDPGHGYWTIKLSPRVLTPMSRDSAPDFSRIIGTTHFNMATGEVGLLIGEKGLWGAGLSKAALSLTLRKVFHSTFKLLTPPGVWAVIHRENDRSLRLFESMGFVHDGTGRSGQCIF